MSRLRMIMWGAVGALWVVVIVRLPQPQPEPPALVAHVPDFSDEKLWRIDQQVTAAMKPPAIYRTAYQYNRRDGSPVLVGVAGVGDELWPVEVEVTAAGAVLSWLIMHDMPKGFCDE